MYLYRIHIRPQGGAAPVDTAFSHCLKNQVLGVGWRVDGLRATQNWEEYEARAKLVHKDLQVCRYIHKWVSAGDLVWTRDPTGQYYLARGKSGWEYWTTKESRDLDIDIANVFRCEIRQVDIDDVPGKVVACFRAPRTFQEIADARAREYSKYLWNVLNNSDDYEVEAAAYRDVFMMLEAEEVEDVVFLYLQHRGWRVVPHSRKGDSMAFEYLCVDPETGNVAGTQVKTGAATLEPNVFVREDLDKVFLFQSGGHCAGTAPKGVEVITRDEIEEFLREAWSWLPGALQKKLRLVGG